MRCRPPARLTDADLASLGVTEVGERATLVQFSSAFCAPCRATRRILGEVASMVEGVTYVEVDAESHLDAMRRFHVLRTPTVLVLDRDRRVVVRASGQPRKADVARRRRPGGRVDRRRSNYVRSVSMYST